jgi:hypothetical protein
MVVVQALNESLFLSRELKRLSGLDQAFEMFEAGITQTVILGLGQKNPGCFRNGNGGASAIAYIVGLTHE